MAKLEITLSKEKYDSLSDELKNFYVPVQKGEGYELEGVASISRALETEKNRNEETISKAKQAALKEALGDIDPEAAKAAVAQLQQIETDKLTKKGEWDTLREQLENRHKAELEKVTAQHDSLLSTLKREKLTNVLTEKGVLPDRAKYLVHELDAQIELENSESGFSLKKKGGIGDAVEFDALIENVKVASPFFFAGQTQSGGGATGSGGNAGGGKTMPEAQFDSMSPREQAAYISSGGSPVST
jgi:hypothetical protein